MTSILRFVLRSAAPAASLIALACSSPSADSADASEAPPDPIAVSGDLAILAAAAPAPPLESGPMAVYVVIGNSGSAPDTLVAVSSPAATRGSVHATRNSGGMSGMGPAGALAVEPGGVLTMEPGGIHVMLDELLVPVVAGDSITLQLEFTRTGSIPVTLPVVTYGDVRSRLGRYATDPD